MDLNTDLGSAADYAQLGGTLLAFVQAVPPGRKRHRSDPDARRVAYLDFQTAIWESVGIASAAVVMADLGRKPIIGGRPWGIVGRTMDLLVDARLNLTHVLSACCAVRLVGNPEPRILAEQMVATIGELLASMPVQATKGERVRSEQEFDRWKARLGALQKEFTLATRRDLGYSGERLHWFQFWRPRVEPWPGGWPVELRESEEPASAVSSDQAGTQGPRT